MTAKHNNEPISKSHLLQYLEGESDFGFELKVLNMLNELEIECKHAGHYQDPVTGVSREFDIRAKKAIKDYRIRMAIECKNIRDSFPILISCVPRGAHESYHEAVRLKKLDGNGPTPVHLLSRAQRFTIKSESSLYKVGDMVGKSTVQVGIPRSNNKGATSDNFIKNDSELYAKWGQCLQSANDLVEEMYYDQKSCGDTSFCLSTVLPFVVVPNNRLWRVSYDEHGKMIEEPVMVDRCSCYVGKSYVLGTETASEEMILSHMEIVTFDGLRSFIQEYLQSESGIKKILPPEAVFSNTQSSSI